MPWYYAAAYNLERKDKYSTGVTLGRFIIKLAFALYLNNLSPLAEPNKEIIRACPGRELSNWAAKCKMVDRRRWPQSVPACTPRGEGRRQDVVLWGREMMCEGWGHCRGSLTAIIERRGGGVGWQKGVGDIIIEKIKTEKTDYFYRRPALFYPLKVLSQMTGFTLSH